MQRKRYAPGRPGHVGTTARAAALLALGLTAGLTGCSAGAATEDVAVDAKAGPAAPVAPPGRYRTLFEPCGAVPQTALRDLLPGAAALPDAERDKAYRGTAAVTYDTDRRVGCSWKADTPEASHRLVLDVERVVSYDPVVSDDARAQEVFSGKQTAAGIPLAPTTPPTTAPTATPSTTAPATAAPPSAQLAGNKPTTTATGATATGAPATGTTATAPSTPTATPSATGLEPRVLEGPGDIAFLDDALGDVGATGRQRVISVVFRTSNVIVTIRYEVRTPGSAEAPDSKELQDKARNLARLLAERLEE